MIMPPRIPVPGQKITETIFRDIINYMKAITPKAGTGTKVSYGPNGAVIDSTATGGRIVSDAFKKPEPFTLRWHKPDQEHSGAFEVYLPTGSMTTDADCVPMNDPMWTGHSGHENDDDWYEVLGYSESDSEKSIIAYVMPGCHMYVAEEGSDEAEEIKNGALTKITIGRYEVGEDEETHTPHDYPTIKVNIPGARLTNEVKTPGHNKLKYTLAKQGGKWTIDNVKLEDVAFDAGGLTVTAADEEISEETEEVWLKLEHKSTNYRLTVELDPADTTNDDDYTWRQLYTMENLYPTIDHRWIQNTMMFLR